MSGVGGSKEKIGRLQELLERVQMRGAVSASDRAHAAAASASTPATSHDGYAAPAAQTSPPPAAYNERDGEMSAAPAQASVHPSVHPYVEPSVPPQAEEDYDINTDSDVEVSSEVVEVDIDIDEPMPLESGAQPVAQQTMPPEDLLEDAEEQPMEAQSSVRPPAESREEEVAHAAPPANEIEEPTPSSSRRPIAGEEASAEEAYEAESSPRHTPPPESGKQVAAAPSAHPPSRKPSAPPPSLEGHTLIGGWREPGLGPAQPIAGVSSGVRVPAPPPPHAAAPGGTEPPATIAQGAGAGMAAAQASGTRLTADVTRPDLASGAQVASFTGAPAIEKPKTLGELLDLTLGL